MPASVLAPLFGSPSLILSAGAPLVLFMLFSSALLIELSARGVKVV